jgi:HKD family nuclease
VLDEAIATDPSTIQIVCPFIKKGPIARFLKKQLPGSLKVITRFNLLDFANGVSDLSALRMLLERGAQIRGIRNLHAKVYLFGDRRAIVTSANLTDAALSRNHEFGFMADDGRIIDQCRRYVEDLWNRAGEDLTHQQVADWMRIVEKFLASGAACVNESGLGDHGVDAGIPPSPSTSWTWTTQQEPSYLYPA